MIVHYTYNLYSNHRIVISIIVTYDTNLVIKNLKYLFYFKPITNNNNNYAGQRFLDYTRSIF